VQVTLVVRPRNHLYRSQRQPFAPAESVTMFAISPAGSNTEAGLCRLQFDDRCRRSPAFLYAATGATGGLE
jgi:hypothetical protein